MEQRKNGATRRQRHLRVPLLPDEEAAIKRQAAAAGLSVAAYLRNVELGLGYEIRGVLDHQRVDELAKINGDDGRLGGLQPALCGPRECLGRWPCLVKCLWQRQ